MHVLHLGKDKKHLSLSEVNLTYYNLVIKAVKIISNSY